MRYFSIVLALLLGFNPALADDPDDQYWHALSEPETGTDGYILGLAMYDGKLAIGGVFSSVGGVTANNIALLDGASWSSPGSGTDGKIQAVIEYDGQLIVGGTFQTASGVFSSRIASWDGSEWLPLGSGTDNVVYCLAVYEGALIAGGHFSTAGGAAASNIARWDGSAWHPLGTGTNERIYALAVYGDKLIAGGNFTIAGGVTANRVACWDGSGWSPLGDGTSGTVFALTVRGRELVVGGSFEEAGGLTTNNIAGWDGSTWHTLGNGTNTTVRALTVYCREIIAGGYFLTADGIGANHIARWDGSSWHPLGSGILPEVVFALTAFDQDLFVGGDFAEAGGHTAYDIASWDKYTYSGPAWYVATTGSDVTGDGSEGAPFSTIQRAVDVAWDGDTVMVAPGTYIGDGNRDVYVTQDSLIVASELGAASTIIDCEADTDDRHNGFEIAVGATLELVGLTIRNGYGNSLGGGIFCDTASELRARDCAFLSNTAHGGGAISCREATVALTNCRITGNRCTSDMDQGGGGISAYGSYVSLRGCTLTHNMSPGLGGAIYAEGESLAITSCVFDSNGSYLRVIQTHETNTTIDSCTLLGGIYPSQNITCYGGNLAIRNCSFEGQFPECEMFALINWNGDSLYCSNVSFDAVGKVLSISGDVVTLDSCVFTDCCELLQGDARLIRVSHCFADNSKGFVLGGDTATISHCSLLNGQYSFYGYTLYSSAHYTVVTNCTFAGNQAQIDFEGNTATLENCLVTGSQLDFYDAVKVGGGSLSVSCCDIYGNAGGDWVGALEGRLGVNGNISTDPLYCDSASGDYSIARLSPCAPSNNSCGSLIGAYQVGCIVHDGPVWYVSTVGNDTTGDGSQSAPFSTIQRAIDMAASGDTILITPGTYGGIGNRDISLRGKGVHLIGQQGPDNTVIDVQDSGYDGIHVYEDLEGDSTASVSGLSIRRGVNGIFLFNQGLTIDNVAVTQCSESGLWAQLAHPVHLTDCRFASNGSGVVLGEYSTHGTIDSCSFESNSESGLAISYMIEGYTMAVANCWFLDNQTGFATSDRVSVRPQNVTLSNCSFEGNAIALSGSGTMSNLAIVGNVDALVAGYRRMELTNCVIRNNTGYVGRIGSDEDLASEVKIKSSLIMGNNNGITDYGLASRRLTLQNCLYASNGGPIEIRLQQYNPDSVENCTLVDNYNGAIEFYGVSGPSIISQNIIARNSAFGLWAAEQVSDGSITLLCNDLYANDGGNFSGSLGDSTGYSGNTSVDPMFCDTSNDNFNIVNTSPCAPDNNSCSVLMGAYGIGCYAPLVDSLAVDPLGDNLHVVADTPVLEWHYYQGETAAQQQFEVQVGTDDDWTTAEMWAAGPQTSPDTFVTYAGGSLLDGETYYCRVRVFGGSWWSLWYETSFRMNTAPTTPLVLRPGDGAISGIVPELWVTNGSDAEADSLTYDFEIYADLAMQWLAKDTQGVEEQPDSTGWYTGLTLTDNETFWWRARSFDGYEYSDWTGLTAFYVNGTNQPPTAPVTILPPDTSGSPVWDMRPTFAWSEPSDPDPLDTLFRYRLQIALDSNFVYVNSIDSIWATAYEVADSLAFDTRYWWRVWACDKTDLCTMSDSRSFWTWTLGDMDHNHMTDITDLSILIDNQFLTLTPIYPMFVADVTGDCQVDIADISRLIDNLFLTLSPLEVGCE